MQSSSMNIPFFGLKNIPAGEFSCWQFEEAAARFSSFSEKMTFAFSDFQASVFLPSYFFSVSIADIDSYDLITKIQSPPKITLGHFIADLKSFMVGNLQS